MTRLTTLLLSLGFAACGSDSADPGTDTVDVLFPDGSFEVTGPDASDTSPADTTPTDTAVDTTLTDTAADSTPPDTIPTDTDTADTAPTDTTPTDTTPADTTPADTGADTTPADTAADTTPADTADTGPGPTCQEGGCVTDVTKLGTTCATAYVIGRPNAQAGFGHLGSTIGAGNDSDFPQAACGDSGPDRFYKIYLKVGEQLWVNGNPSPASYDLSYGLYRGENCETPITCVDNDVNGTTPDTMPYQAVVEGWHVLVVDGRASQGDYSLVVTLDCQEDNCCCE